MSAYTYILYIWSMQSVSCYHNILLNLMRILIFIISFKGCKPGSHPLILFLGYTNTSNLTVMSASVLLSIYNREKGKKKDVPFSHPLTFHISHKHLLGRSM